MRQDLVIQCQVHDGRGSVLSENNKVRAGETEFPRWVFSDNGLDLGDRVFLFWHHTPEGRSVARVAVDGPVSKPAELISITDDTATVTVITSDQDTTRSWLFLINFRHNNVVALGASSNSGTTKGQLISLECRFTNRLEANIPPPQAADGWRR